MENWLFLIPLLPLVAFALDLILGRRFLGKRAHIPAWLALGGSFVASVLAVLEVRDRGEAISQTLWRWMPGAYLDGFDIPLTIYVDQLTSVMILIITGIGLLIHIYSAGYMGHDAGYYRFFAYLSLFIFAMLVLVLGDNYLVMFFGWEGVGLCSYLLIGYWFERRSAGDAAKKAFIVNRIGDFGFIIGMFLAFTTFGTLSFFGPEGVFENIAGKGEQTLTAIALLLFVGAMGKSAQGPLFVWLPDAMEGPTPVSALIHAATMVTAGIYMMVRSWALYEAAPAAMTTVLLVGLATCFIAATIGLVQNDIKRVMAYSTVSQLGYMAFAVGAGAFIPAIFHLMTHAFFKALLFLGAGSVIHGMHEEQDMRRMGGLRRYMPYTYGTLLVGALALAGFPLTAGFFSKDEILVGTWLGGYPWAAVIGWIVAFMTAFYTFRMIFMTFHGRPRFDAAHVHPHESPWVMVLPLIALAIPSAVIGLALGWPPEAGGIHRWLEPVFEAGGGHAGVTDALAIAAQAEEHHPSTAFTIGAFLASAVTSIAGIALAYAMYVTGRISPRAVGQRFAAFYDIFYNKWFVDAIYGQVVVRPLDFFSRILWKWVDAGFIDGIVNGVAYLTGGISQRLRKVQTGIVSNYALAIALGTVVIVGVYLLFGPQFLAR
ncbi:MAG: NADH-quinone oxidoreductase subunit L [Chloroflexota bacterium]|nr:NADH-quinone oxidoreductase subunit L [Chloroflexota bacterium]